MVNIKDIIEINKEEKNKNLLIESDNLDWLEFLKKEYEKWIDIIMIDPPYNTNTELNYNDKFWKGIWIYTWWMKYLKPRIEKALPLLKENWIIMVNIDEKEHFRLRFLLNELFWEDNFICDFVWITWWWKNDSWLIKKKTEYISTYAINKAKVKFNLKKSDDKNYRYKDKVGKYAKRWFAMQWLKYSPSLDYIITAPNWEELVPWYNRELYEERKQWKYEVRDWCWTLSQKEFQKRKDEDRIIFEKDKKTKKYKVYYKAYYEGKYTAYDNIIYDINSNPINHLKKMFNWKRVFDYPKPVELLKYLLKIVSQKDSIILDF